MSMVTLHEENAKMFARAMRGLIDSITHLCTRDRSQTWGREGWKKARVFVPLGRHAFTDTHLRSWCASYPTVGSRSICTRFPSSRRWVYIKTAWRRRWWTKKPVAARIYEYTTQVLFGLDLRMQSAGVPMQVLFCLQEKYQRGVNFHRQLFVAFTKVLQPHICLFLDIGTILGPRSIYDLWKPFDRDIKVAGARTGKLYGLNLWNPLTVIRRFENHMDDMLENPDEAVRKPSLGAMTAYRSMYLRGVLSTGSSDP